MSRQVIGIIFGTLAMSACNKPAAPDCMADDTKYEVIHRVYARQMLGRDASWKEMRDSMASKGGMSSSDKGGKVVLRWRTGESGEISLSSIRIESRDKDVGSWKCAANFVLKQSQRQGADSEFVPVTYSSELADGGRTHYVTAVLGHK